MTYGYGGDSAILGIGTAVPPHRVRQDDAAERLASALSGQGNAAKWTRRLFRQCGVETRFTCERSFMAEAGQSRYLTGEAASSPSTKERGAAYREHALPLALAAAERALHDAGVEAADITHLLAVSCTGLYLPGLDAELVRQLGLKRDVQRLPLSFVGCAAGLKAIGIAAGITAHEQLGAKALVVCVELCTLHLQPGTGRNELLAAAMFGDGAAACVVGGVASADGGMAGVKGTSKFTGTAGMASTAGTPGKAGTAGTAGMASTAGTSGKASAAGERGATVTADAQNAEHTADAAGSAGPYGGRGRFRLGRYRSVLLEEGAGEMTWHIGDNGYELYLSPRIPELLVRLVPEQLARLTAGLPLREPQLWAIHPGGRGILDALKGVCGLSERQLEPSRTVLKNIGNVSSATILFVLDELRRSLDAGGEEPNGCGVALAFGPGLTAELLTFAYMAPNDSVTAREEGRGCFDAILASGISGRS